MSLNVITVKEKDYDERLKTFMAKVEGTRLDAYVDTKGNPTIGWGFALIRAGILRIESKRRRRRCDLWRWIDQPYH